MLDFIVLQDKYLPDQSSISVNQDTIALNSPVYQQLYQVVTSKVNLTNQPILSVLKDFTALKEAQTTKAIHVQQATCALMVQNTILNIHAQLEVINRLLVNTLALNVIPANTVANKV